MAHIIGLACIPDVGFFLQGDGPRPCDIAWPGRILITCTS